MNIRDIRFKRPTRQKFYELLSDGRKHQVRELVELLPRDKHADPKQVVRQHINDMRKVLNPIGLDIVAQQHSRRCWYLMVRTL